MGRRGPKPQSREERIAKGNPSKRPLPPEPPALQTSAQEAPPDLKGEARKEWDRVAPELIKKGALKAAHRTIFAQYCQLHADVKAYEKLNARVERQEAHQLGYANHLLKLRALLRQFAAECGVTPQSWKNVKHDTPARPTSPEPSDPEQSRARRFLLKRPPGPANPVVGKIGDGSPGS